MSNRGRETGGSVTRGEALAFGAVTGAAAGLLAGLAEAIPSPLTLPWRMAFVVAVDVLIGAAWGMISALPVVAGRVRRREGIAPVASFVVAITLLPGLAAALGLLVNRVLLSGTHFLSPLSLLADLVAVIVAALLAVGAGAAARRIAAGARPPHPLGAAFLLAPPLVILLLPHVRPGASRPEAAVSVPTIVIVSIDTLRPDRLGTGGFPDATSPELDRFCREGVQFTQALAVSPGSAASHAALFTSRYPVSNGVWSNFSVMDEDVVTVAELAREAGYRTGGFATNTFLGRRFHFDQGFETYVESGQVERLEEPGPAALRRSLALVQIIDRVRVRLQPGYDPSFETALRWLRESDRPTFLFVHLMDVHSPYVPPHPWGDRFGAARRGNAAKGRRPNRFGWIPSEEAYAAELRFADTKMGRLRRALEATGRLGDSALLITSDHGENLLDHEPNYSHGQTMFEATLAIVAALRAPAHGVTPALVPDVVENTDLLPTLASVIGWPRHPDWTGDSFHPVPPSRPDTTFAQLSRDFAIRTSTSKYVLREDGGRDYFLLDRDPGERDAALLEPDDRRRMEEHLARWLERNTTDLYRDRSKSVSPDDLSPELRDKLRALGYVK